MRIGIDAAREYFEHPSQRRGCMIDPGDLPGEPCEYWADEGVCVVFHPALWPGVWMVHVAVKPEAWGRTVKPTRRILEAFWGAEEPQLIIAWALEGNRALRSFSRRVGFQETGVMSVPSGAVVTMEWKLCH